MRPTSAIGSLLALTFALACRPSTADTTSPSPPPSAVETPPASPSPPADAKTETDPDSTLRARFACPADSPDYRTARDELRSLDADIQALADLDDPAPLLSRVTTLLDSPCLGLARLHTIPLHADSGLALRLWRERGGIAWLADAMRFSKGEQGAVVTLPPTMPITLALQTHPEHPLAPWLCALGDEACAATTGGWRARAQQVMGRNQQIRYVVDQQRDTRRCQEEVSDYDPERRYPGWARCMFEAEGDNTEFPLGGLAAPQAGWLLVEGRRGHYRFCDELHAYELQTGAAHVVRSCSGLAFAEDASIDEQEVAKGRRLEHVRGTVPRDNVRELAWMLLVADYVRSPAIPKIVHLPRPEALELPATARSIDMAQPVGWGGSDRTELHWIFVPPTGPALEGTFYWYPGYNRPPLRHAAELLTVVEDGIVPGCPPRSIPAMAKPGTLSGVSPIDASTESLDEEHAVLWATLRDETRCTKKR